MRILTLNTWQERGPWRERWELIFQRIEKLSPDVMAFQEVFNGGWAEQVRKRTGMQALVFSHDECGLIMLSRCPVVEWDCYTMKTQSPTEDYKRYVLYALFETGQGDVACFNTHLTWRIEESEIRQKQVNELLAYMDEKAAGRETLLTGDFNATDDSPEIQKLVQEGGLTDSFKSKHPTVPGFTWDNRNPYTAGSNPPMPDRRIDYLFYRAPGESLAELSRAEIAFYQPGEGGIYPSDHFGLLVTFSARESYQGGLHAERSRKHA